MNWDLLPYDITNLIFIFRKKLMYFKFSIIKIQSMWRLYRIKKLFSRYMLLRYIKEFRYYNPNINIFFQKSKL